MTTMDPYAQAAWDLEMAKFRNAIGQVPDDSVSAFLSGGYHGLIPHIGPANVSPITGQHSWHQHWAITPAAARAIMGMQQIVWTEPSRWDRLKGMVSQWVRNRRKWLAQKIAGRNFDVY